MIRATILIDCGRHSGLGRVRRTLTLLDAFRAQNVEARVFLSDKEGAGLVAAKGYDYQVGMPTDLSNDILVVDTCTLDSTQINSLCAKARVSCVIDDLGQRPVNCDYAINPNLYAEAVDYGAYRARRVFYGPAHSLLAEDFFNRKSVDQERNGIVVSFGGTDDGSLAATVASQLCKKTSEPIYVPLPDYIEPSEKLTALVLTEPNVELLRSPAMPELLGGARLYVGAAGATVLEALASGCRVCVAATQSDQIQNVAFLPTLGIPALNAFNPDALATMAADLLDGDRPAVVFDVNAPMDIAAAALDTYHQVA